MLCRRRACRHVQVYGECDHLKLHDVVEVLGVMSVLPGLAALHLDQHHQHNQDQGDQDAAMLDADDFWQERVAALPPTSQVLVNTAAYLFMVLYASRIICLPLSLCLSLPFGLYVSKCLPCVSSWSFTYICISVLCVVFGSFPL